MNRSRKLMTSFILSVLLLSGFLYMQQEMSVGGAKRSPSHNHGNHAADEEVVDVTDEAVESNSPITGPQADQNALGTSAEILEHVDSHFHGEQAEADGTWFYENKRNQNAGHTFVLLKPLVENPAETSFYGYHLSQYGPKHQHFVIAKISVRENGDTESLNTAELYAVTAPTNNFYSVSTSPRAQPGVTNPFHLIELLKNVGSEDIPETSGCESSATDSITTVTSCAVSMFDGTLLDSQNAAAAAPGNDFRQHAVSGSPGAAVQTVLQLRRLSVSTNRRVVFNEISRFEHIDVSEADHRTEYVAIKYTEGATKDYYLVHRIKGNSSYQQVVQVEFKNPVNLQNLKAYLIYKTDDLASAMEEKRESSLVPGASYALKVADTPVEFEVKSNVIWLPMTSLR